MASTSKSGRVTNAVCHRVMTSVPNAPTQPVSNALLRRARQVIPNAMYGPQDVRGLWPGAPQFVSRPSDSRIWDADAVLLATRPVVPQNGRGSSCFAVF